MKRTKIITKTKEDFRTVVTLMVASGTPFSEYHPDSSPEKYTNRCWPGYSCVIHGDDTINSCGSGYRTSRTLCWPEDSEKVINLIFKTVKEYKVENVGDYSAEITPEGIEVGCQTISFDKFQEIVDKVAEFKADQ